VPGWCGLLLLASGLVQAASPAAQARYREGTQALAEHRYEAARSALREAVRLDPDFAGAWLDLAIATHALGERVQAEELLDTLEARFAVPPALADVIARLRQQIAAASAPPAAPQRWRWRRQLGAAAPVGRLRVRPGRRRSRALARFRRCKLRAAAPDVLVRRDECVAAGRAGRRRHDARRSDGRREDRHRRACARTRA
jgi:tetratricopeptide (TPR) repeat protein